MQGEINEKPFQNSPGSRLSIFLVEVFFNQPRICSHVRLHGKIGQYGTATAYMPDDHKEYTKWNAERFVDWANGIGANTAITVKAILASHKIEQQGYRSCMWLLKLAEKYSVNRLEAACCKALPYTPRLDAKM